MSRELDLVKHGYVAFDMVERGHFLSEDNWDILGLLLSDTDDEFKLDALPALVQREGRINRLFVSAEWQLGTASLGNKALTAIIPKGFGAGLGKVGPYNEQGTWYGGGAGNRTPGGPGALDQRKMEERPEILVYTSVLTKDVEISCPVTVTLYVSSDVKDTDVTAKLIDVLPDGTAYNLDQTIQRLHYRDGDDHNVWLEKDKVYKVTLTPLNTSNLFAVGHRLRLEVAGSNFPRFDRNLNTGGHNYDETNSVVAHTSTHYSAQYPSSLTLTVVPAEGKQISNLRVCKPCRDQAFFVPGEMRKNSPLRRRPEHVHEESRAGQQRATGGPFNRGAYAIP